jgi:anti-anti-sigma factor
MEIGGRTVLAPEISITFEHCQEIEEKIDDFIKQNKTELILDCKGVPFLDSEALELLVRTHDTLKNKGGALKIVNLNAVCRDILVATRLTNLLYVFEDIHKAITGGP